MGKWITIVGPHVAQAAPPVPKRTVRYVLETVTNATTAECTEAQRAALLYERGVGPQRPDEKPEPTTAPRQGKAVYPPADRSPKAWTGDTDLSAMPGPMLDSEREFWVEGKWNPKAEEFR